MDIPGTEYYVPKGWKIRYLPPVVHCDEEFWGANPKEFQPDRFVERSQHDKLSMYYIPFGGGNRACLGEHFARLEMRVFLVRVTQNRFRVNLATPGTASKFPINMVTSSFRVLEG